MSSAPATLALDEVRLLRRGGGSRLPTPSTWNSTRANIDLRLHEHEARHDIVEKQTNPADSAQSFTFTGDAAGSHRRQRPDRRQQPMPGTYTSTEAVTPDWVLDSIVCNDGESQNPSSGSLVDRKATFKLDPGETVKCTFTDLVRQAHRREDGQPGVLLQAGDLITYTVTATNVGAADAHQRRRQRPAHRQAGRAGPAPSMVRLSPSGASLAPGKPSSARPYTSPRPTWTTPMSIPNTACAVSAQTSKPVRDDEDGLRSPSSPSSRPRRTDLRRGRRHHHVHREGHQHRQRPTLTSVVMTDKMLAKSKLNDFTCSPRVPVAPL